MVRKTNFHSYVTDTQLTFVVPTVISIYHKMNKKSVLYEFYSEVYKRLQWGCDYQIVTGTNEVDLCSDLIYFLNKNLCNTFASFATHFSLESLRIISSSGFVLLTLSCVVCTITIFVVLRNLVIFMNLYKYS